MKTPEKFTLRNTKVGQTKWTRTWTGKNKERKTVPVVITKTGTLVDGKTIAIHGVIKGTKETLVISHSGRDNRFWGRCYHTKEQADKLGW